MKLFIVFALVMLSVLGLGFGYESYKLSGEYTCNTTDKDLAALNLCLPTGSKVVKGVSARMELAIEYGYGDSVKGAWVQDKNTMYLTNDDKSLLIHEAVHATTQELTYSDLKVFVDASIQSGFYDRVKSYLRDNEYANSSYFLSKDEMMARTMQVCAIAHGIDLPYTSSDEMFNVYPTQEEAATMCPALAKVLARANHLRIV